MLTYIIRSLRKAPRYFKAQPQTPLLSSRSRIAAVHQRHGEGLEIPYVLSDERYGPLPETWQGQPDYLQCSAVVENFTSLVVELQHYRASGIDVDEPSSPSAFPDKMSGTLSSRNMAREVVYDAYAWEVQYRYARYLVCCSTPYLIVGREKLWDHGIVIAKSLVGYTIRTWGATMPIRPRGPA